MWQIDVAMNTAKAMFPFQQQLRTFKRRIKPPAIGPQHASVISGGIDHILALEKAGCELKNKDILEIGSGWFPIIPLLLRLAGARHVHLTDEHVLMDADTLLAAVDCIRSRSEEISARLPLKGSLDFKAVEIDRNCSLEGMLCQLNFTYRAPFDPVRVMPQVDAVVSHTVFEHIPPHVIRNLLVHVKRGLKPGGFMSHGIDNTDHRAHRDRSLNRFDFLRYSDEVWKMLCLNPQDYTNRLRHSDYKAIFEELKFSVILENIYCSEGGIKEVKQLRLADRFQKRDVRDLATGWSHLVLRRDAIS